MSRSLKNPFLPRLLKYARRGRAGYPAIAPPRLAANRGWARARAPIMRHPEKEEDAMTAKQLLGEKEARGTIQGSSRWNVVLDKQWRDPTFPEGGLAVQKRATGPLRRWPSPSSGMRGGS